MSEKEEAALNDKLHPENYDQQDQHGAGSRRAGVSEQTGWEDLPLAPQHVEKLKSSGISADIAFMRGYETVFTYDRLDELGFAKDLCKSHHLPGLLIPQLDARGSVWGYQYRPDAPRINAKGKPIKYESQTRGQGRRRGLDIPPLSQSDIGDPKEEKWIVEGSLKADALAEQGICAISVSGVWNWRGTNGRGGKVALPDWNDVAIEESEFVLAYDSDVVHKRPVHSAMVALSNYLYYRAGNRVRYCHLSDGPDGQKWGVDDYLAAGHTKEELFRLVKPDCPALRNWPHGDQDGDDKDDSSAASAEGEAPPPYGSIDGAAVLDKLEAWYRRFIRVTFDGDYHLLALWTVHTYLVEECYTTPRLQLDSLMPGAGKTTVLDHLKRLAHNPIQIASLSSPALLPRLLHSGMHTILLDEAHRTLRPENPGVGDLVAIINTGYRRGAARPVNVPVKNGGWEVASMPTFAPVALAGNGPNLENDTQSRMIRILLMPDLDGSVEDSDWEYLEDDAEALQNEIALWAASARETVKMSRVEVPAGCVGRSKEKWRPIKRVAAAAGGRWEDIANDLIQRGLEEEAAARESGLRKQPPGMVLLTDLRAVWPEDHDFMPTKELVALLVAHNPGYWGADSPYGKGLTETRLGTMVNQATNSTSTRIGGVGPRGYTRAALQVAWDRLRIGPTGSSSTSTNPVNPANPANPAPGRDHPAPDAAGSTGSTGSTGSQEKQAPSDAAFPAIQPPGGFDVDERFRSLRRDLGLGEALDSAGEQAPKINGQLGAPAPTSADDPVPGGVTQSTPGFTERVQRIVANAGGATSAPDSRSTQR
jgi:hypothetical protein